jgi:hypothetical protein
MNNIAKVALGVAVVALLVGGSAYMKNSQVVTQIMGSSGQDQYARFTTHSGATLGGNQLATSTSVASYTLTPSDLNDKTILSITPTVNLTLSVGATSSGQLVPRVGDTYSMYIKNASTSKSALITLASADSSTDLQVASSTTANLTIGGLNWDKVTFIRNALTGTAQIAVILDQMKEGD